MLAPKVAISSDEIFAGLEADVRNLESTGAESTGEIELALDPERFPVQRYKPLQELGKGASGSVYLCRDRMLGEKVAVKTLRQLNGEQLIAFQSEARANSKLNHQAIITLLDFGPTPGGTPYMVLAYFKGVTLEEFLRKHGALPTNMFKQVFEQITSALTHAHSKGIFHRDLKPSNILIGRGETNERITTESTATNLQVKLIDFGVARIKEDTAPTLSAQGTTIAGTPAYMPPDSVLGKSYDARSEVYSLGCVMFESLTGKTPFSGETALETMNLHAQAVAPTLSEAGNHRYSDDLESIVSKCLSKDPDERFSSMQELHDAVRAIQVAPDTVTTLDSLTEEWSTSNGERSTTSGERSTKRGEALPGRRVRKTTIIVVAAVSFSTLLLTSIFVMRALDLDRSTTQKPESSTRTNSAEINDLRKLGLTVNEKALIRKPANKDDVSETVKEADAYYHGRGVPRDYFRAAQLYLKAAKNGNAAAQESIGFMFEQGLGVSKNDQKALEWYQKSALQNNAVAQLNLGTMYLEGRGTKLDYAMALYWTRKAAAAGNARAQNNLGYQYQHGFGVTQNYKKAQEYYRTAGKNGEPMAYVNLGDLYREGIGVKNDDTQAFKFYRQAAEEGIAAGQRSLAFMYVNGIGTKKNYPEALAWFRKAATRGDIAAHQWLGFMALNGLGVPQNETEACIWYLKAAERGDLKSQCALGHMYKNGIGVKKDLNESTKWYRRAAENGSDEAAQALKSIDNKQHH